MNKPKFNNINLLNFVAIISMIFAISINAEDSQTALYYYNGSVKVDLQIQEGIIAEFAKANQGQKSLSNSIIQKTDASATMLKSYGNALIWKSSSKADSASLSKSLNQSSGSNFSPVLTTVKGSQLLALPGNILVELTNGYSAKQAEEFFAKHGLRSLQKLDMPGRNIYEVETPPGIAALNAANSLIGKEGVVSSSPNFWREMVAK